MKKKAKPAKRKAARKPKTGRKVDSIQAYKGFDKDWKCQGFQFKVGESYEHKGEVKLCASGFHAAEYPFDVFSYYKGGNYAAVTLGKASAEKERDSKRVGGTIRLDAKLSLLDLIKAQVKMTVERAGKENLATGDSGHAAATGNYGHAAATGYSGHAAATGDSGHAAATGDSGHAAATGNYGASFVGFNGKAKAGAKGSFAIAWFDKEADRARLIVGTPGENGIKADQWYAVKDGALVEATV